MQRVVAFPMRVSSTLLFHFFLLDRWNGGPGGDNRLLVSLAYEGVIFILAIEWVKAAFGFWTSHTNITVVISMWLDRWSKYRTKCLSISTFTWEYTWSQTQTCFENYGQQFVAGKPVLSPEVDREAAGLMVEPCAVLARRTHSLLLVQPQEPSQASQLHCWVPVSQSYAQHAIIQLWQWSHTGEEKQVKNRSPSVRVFRDEEQ